MKKHVNRLLSAFLVVLMLLSLLPASVLAAGGGLIIRGDRAPAETVEEETSTGLIVRKDETEEPESTSSDFMKILHLDCGRKYFTADWIKALITEAAADGYTHVQLAFGNDGLRFLLDDMSVKVGETTYDSEKVSTAINNGNKEYYDATADKYDPQTANELTQAEMDEIITYAKSVNVEIIPLLNTPGHMDSILYAMKDLQVVSSGYDGSVRTIDVTDATASAFVKALVEKYASYFSEKGCRYFNIGADEYANDVHSTGSMGFGKLISEGQYDDFANYVNELAAIVKKYSMVPMAFNDGIYYNGDNVNYDESTVKFDTDIIISYWSNGWSGYTPASADYLLGKGFKLINTNSRFYFILQEKNDEWQSFTGTSYEFAEQFSNNTYINNYTTTNNTGSCFCIWCDVPGINTLDEVAARARLILRAMGWRMNEKSVTSEFDTSVTAYGFNEDGSINDGTVNVPGEPVSVTLGTPTVLKLTGLTTELTQADASVVDESVVKVTVSSTPVTTGGQGMLRGDATSIADGQYVIASGDTTLVTSDTSYSNGTLPAAGTSVDDAAIWTITSVNGGYTISREINGTTYYLGLGDRNITTRPLIISTSTENTVWTYVNDAFYQSFSFISSDYTYYIRYDSRRGWNTSNGSSTITLYDVYQDDPAVTTYDATITFEGFSVGETSATVGDVKYDVTVEAPNADSVEPLAIEYWITNEHTYDNNNNHTLSITAEQASGTNGIEVATLVPAITTRANRERDLVYWCVRLLNRSTVNDSSDGKEEQSTTGSDDETSSGIELTHIRYSDGIWAVLSTDGTWHDVPADYQLVAYYLEVVDVSDELTVNAADWGYSSGQDMGYGYILGSLSVQVVYEDSTTNPTATDAASLIPTTLLYSIINTSDAYPNGRGIGRLFFDGKGDYSIWKITAETGDLDASWQGTTPTITNLSWYNNEKTIWEDENGVETATIGNNTRKPNSSSPYDNLMWYQGRNDAILIRVYVKTNPKEDTLNVHYIDNTAGGYEFYNYSIRVKAGTVFDSGFGLNDSGVLINNTVENYFGTTQKVEQELSKLVQLAARYRFLDYTLESVERSDDGKDVYLYYTFKSDDYYVVDFGLPLKMDLGLQNTEGATFSVSSAKYGTATVDSSGVVTYKPGTVFRGAETLDITIASEDNQGNSTENAVRRIYIFPASNVLYEADQFMTETQSTAGTKTGVAWTETETDSNITQSSHVLNGEKLENHYGMDGVYQDYLGNNARQNSLGSSYTVTLNANGFSNYLTTSFTGNMVDVIGTCGTETAYAFITVLNAENKGKLVVVDTSYTGVANPLYEVPLAHIVMDAVSDYTLTVYAAYRQPGTGTQGNSAVNAYGLNGAINSIAGMELLDDIMAETNLTMDDVEFIYFDESSAFASLDGATMSSYAVNRTSETVQPMASTTAGTTLTIDCFRVYNTDWSSTYSAYYYDFEQNVSYDRVLDLVTEDFTAYVENQSGTWTSANYESNGGPQNEIYLQTDNAVVIKTGAGVIGTLQLSARSADGIKAKIQVTYQVGEAQPVSRELEINHETELYYIFKDVPDNAIVTITSTGEGMLALANVKYKGTLEKPTETEVEQAIMMLNLLYSEEEDDTFEPGMFEYSMRTSKLLKRTMVTVSVKSSTDVAYITINGQKVTPSNAVAVRWGFADTYVYSFTELLSSGQSPAYEIIAYDADGNASATYYLS